MNRLRRCQVRGDREQHLDLRAAPLPQTPLRHPGTCRCPLDAQRPVCYRVFGATRPWTSTAMGSRCARPRRVVDPLCLLRIRHALFGTDVDEATIRLDGHAARVG
eukprot:2218824-Rhodomonas_salina.1